VELAGFDPANVEEVKRDIAAFLQSKVGQKAQTREVKMTILPFWVIRQRVKTRYNGYRRETRGTGKNQYTVYVPVRGEFDEEVPTIVYARTFESLFGLVDIKSRILSRLGEVGKLDAARASKESKLIGPEVSETEAVDRAETLVSEMHRKRAERMTSKLFDCYTETKLISSRLVMYPVAQTNYEWEGKIFRISVDASRGVKERPLKAELPITAARRILLASATVAILLLIALASTVSQFIIGADSSGDGGSASLLAVVLPPAAAGLLGWYGSRKATSEQRVWRRTGGERLSEDVEEILGKLKGGIP